MMLEVPRMTRVRGGRQGSEEYFQSTSLLTGGTMVLRTSTQDGCRAKRFALQFPVYFREPDSPDWMEGMTENISYTGLLFRSASPLAPETMLELRLKFAKGSKRKQAAEIRCKGKVVRQEQRFVPETPIALAVAIRDYRIVGQHSMGGKPVGSA
jgi:hypothetical protein